MSHDECGLCQHCNTLNPYSIFDCRECGQRLPWADALTLKLFEGQRLVTNPTQQGQNSFLPADVPFQPVVPTQQLSYCASCGTAYQAPANFCPACGKRANTGMMTGTLPSHIQQNWPFNSHQLATLQNDNVLRVAGVGLALMFLGWVLLSGATTYVQVLSLVFAFIIVRRLLR